MINNEIPQKLRLIASGTHMVGMIPLMLFSVLNILLTPSGAIFTILPIVLQPILALFAWRETKNIHSFVDISGRDAVNCALNTVLGTSASILFVTFTFSVTCGIGYQDPTLFYISLFILCCIEFAYFMNSVITGIFALRGYRFKSRLIYPFIKPE
jgi:uncharacterized Tic20 family protein